jgi:hypothetical protein
MPSVGMADRGVLLPRLLLVACVSLAVAGCNAATLNRLSNAPISEQNPGTSVKVKNPDPDKWSFIPPVQPVQSISSVPPAPPRPGMWACKPLACSGDTAVVVTTGRSPTRNPDRTALEKAAKLLPTQFKAQDLMVEAASEGDDRITPLSSKVTSLRGYPAIVAEAKRTTRRKDRFMMRGDIFIGLLTVRTVSVAPTRAEAAKHFESFVAAMEIVDVERQPANAPVTALDTQAPMAVQ